MRSKLRPSKKPPPQPQSFSPPAMTFDPPPTVNYGQTLLVPSLANWMKVMEGLGILTIDVLRCHMFIPFNRSRPREPSR
jgi:hypothetical protein